MSIDKKRMAKRAAELGMTLPEFVAKRERLGLPPPRQHKSVDPKGSGGNKIPDTFALISRGWVGRIFRRDDA